MTTETTPSYNNHIVTSSITPPSQLPTTTMSGGSSYHTTAGGGIMYSLTAVQIPCCLCGTMIYPNTANQCSNCLVQNYNLQEYIQRGPGNKPYNTIYQCRECRRYQRTTKHYEAFEPESSDLLALCLKQIPALQQQHGNSSSSNGPMGNTSHINGVDKNLNVLKKIPMKVVDAQWIWTEPHSMRFKIGVTVRAEILSVPVQQRCCIDLHVAWQQCPDCQKTYQSRTWYALVQIRQKVQRLDPQQIKKGLIEFENGIQKAPPSLKQSIVQMDHVQCGFDFYFTSFAHAQSFVTYIQSVVPCKTGSKIVTSKLVSTDSKNNTAHMKHTITLELLPLLKNDLLVIHKKTPKNTFAGKLVIVENITSTTLHLLDATPARNSQTNYTTTGSGNSITTSGSFISTMTINGSRKKKNKRKIKNQLESICSSNHSNTNSSIMNFSGIPSTTSQQQGENVHRTATTELNRIEVPIESYCKNEKNYIVLESSNRMVRFVVLDIELCNPQEQKQQQQKQTHQASIKSSSSFVSSSSMYRGPKSGISKYALADVVVARETDLGLNNHTYHCVSHLGHLLSVGDTVLGYDIQASTNTMERLAYATTDATTTNSVTAIGDTPSDLMEVEGSSRNTEILRHNFILPDVVLVKKIASALSNTKSDVIYDDHVINTKSHPPQSIQIHPSTKQPKNNNIPTTIHELNLSVNELNLNNNHHHLETDEVDQNDSHGEFDNNDNNNNSNDNHHHGTDDLLSDGTKPLISKKKERRRLRQQGKRKKLLEKSAIRMGLLEPTNLIHEGENDDDDDDVVEENWTDNQ